MNVVKSSRNSSSSLPKGSTTVVDETTTTNNINLYQNIPNIEVSLDDFEEFALDRLKVRDTKNVCDLNGTRVQIMKMMNDNIIYCCCCCCIIVFVSLFV
jgi:hypothetical protein